MESSHQQDNFGWQPQVQDYKVILEQLKSRDEMLVYEAVMQLQNNLSIAQENTLTNFAVDQYIPALIEILKKHPESDISNEINMFTIQCLTNLMDIFPNICNNIVTNGGVKCLAQVLERSMGFIDLNEACIKGIEKISTENPYAILTSGVMGLVLNMMDFFENTTQKRIISILLNISRHSATEQDLNEHLYPLLPCLSMLLQSRGGSDAESKIESVSSIILRICESIFRFLSPNSQLDKLSLQFDNLGHTGIIDGILQSLQDYCVFADTMKQSMKSVHQTQQQQSVQKQIMTNLTIQNFLKVLGICSSYSLSLTQMILNFNILQLIEEFLPSNDDQKQSNFQVDQFPFIMETISLIDSLLPQREEEISDDPAKQKSKFERDKRALYLNQQQQSQIFFAAEKLLPRIFNVHENNIQTQVRVKTLQTIDKLLLLFNEELLNNFIEPYSFAKFIYSNLRTNQLSSILSCLQMVDKLMKSNAKTYTLPLIREGVTVYIKQLSSLDKLEKLAGVSFTEVEAVDRHEQMLAHAKNVLIRGPNSGDAEQQQLFEQTIQKYMEIAKLQSGIPGTLTGNRQQIVQGKQIIALSESLTQSYFDNQQFLDSINELCGDEFQIMKKLKELAEGIIEESKKQDFDFERNKVLLKSLAVHLTKQRALMNYELKESGLLEALKMYLTMTPKQIELLCERNKASGEEVKHSEEIQMNTMTKTAKNVSKKQARCFIQRLKIFLHVVLNKINDKQPIVELVNLCHELLSQSEHLIFDQHEQQQNIPSQYGGGQPHQLVSDPSQSMNALKQLTRRMRVNLVYDQSKCTTNTDIKKFARDQAMSGVTQEQNSQSNIEALMPPPSLQQKSNSHHPAFMHLAGGQQAPSSANQDQQQSKVFIKRQFLYTELKQVMVSVEQCASLFLLEDFLRNRIKTLEEVKSLKAPQSFYSSMKQAAGGSSKQPPRQARVILERALERMRDMIENGGNRERMRAESEDFSQVLVDEIVNTKELSEIDQIDIIRQLEIHSLQMMDDFYADHQEEGFEEGVNFEDRLIQEAAGGGGDDLDTEERLYEFQRTIQRVRDAFRIKKQDPTEKQPKVASQPDTDMKEVKNENNEADIDQEQHAVGQENEEEKRSTLQKQADNEDVEMTDEDEEEQRRIMDMINIKRQILRNAGPGAEAVVLGGPVEQVPDATTEDLEQLLKASGGDDIEYEFFIGGEQLLPNQTIYELLRQVESKARRQNKEGSGAMAGYLAQLHAVSGRESDQITIQFAIKEKTESLSKTRKDSMFEFAQKRERSKSEVVNDFSQSSVNQFVQQLIEKEFCVIGSEAGKQDAKYAKDWQLLESSLKILKVLNFMCRNINLLSCQGIKFFGNGSTHLKEEEEMKEEGFQDLDLQVGLSQIHSNLFHHHKLDAFILKNIQDPYNLISGAVSEMLTTIFKNCSFLFPFQTRLLFFKLISFIGSIDMNRSIFFLKQFLKQKLGKLPPDDKNTQVKIQRQKVTIDRTRILECSLNLLSKVSNRAFLEVEYKDEVGTGLGPTLEYYCLVAQEIKGFKCNQQNVWRLGQADNCFFPSPLNIQVIGNDDLQKVYELFRVSGMLIAKSISDDRLIDLPISPLFWDLVLGKKMNIFDLERLDPQLFKVFADLQLLANKKRDLDKQMVMDSDLRSRQLSALKTNSGAHVEDLSLTFILPGFDNIELKLDGKDTDVTIHNLQEYIDLTMHYLFHETIKVQIQAFKKGFNQIFPVENLRPFANQSNELEDMICGTQRNDEEWSNPQKLSEFIVPAHGYHMKSAQYLYFLRFISELDKEERRKFLQFVTGSPRLPNGGFGSLDPKLTLVLKKPTAPSVPSQLLMEIINTSSNIDQILPSVMTCQNYVKLPAYSCYEVLKDKFKQAYNDGSNSFTMS